MTGRIAPSLTIDSQGEVGAQVLVSAGLAIYNGEHSGGDRKDRSLELGLGAGGSTSRGDAAESAAIFETYADWFFLPQAAEDNGLVTRIGARFGLRPTTFDDGYGAIGVAAAALYRFSQVRVESDDWMLRKVVVHFVGIEGRCDYLMRLTDNTSKQRGTICAVGPNYEFMSPFLAGLGRL